MQRHADLAVLLHYVMPWRIRGQAGLLDFNCTHAISQGPVGIGHSRICRVSTHI